MNFERDLKIPDRAFPKPQPALVRFAPLCQDPRLRKSPGGAGRCGQPSPTWSRPAVREEEVGAREKRKSQPPSAREAPREPRPRQPAASRVGAGRGRRAMRRGSPGPSAAQGALGEGPALRRAARRGGRRVADGAGWGCRPGHPLEGPAGLCGPRVPADGRGAGLCPPCSPGAGAALQMAAARTVLGGPAASIGHGRVKDGAGPMGSELISSLDAPET